VNRGKKKGQINQKKEAKGGKGRKGTLLFHFILTPWVSADKEKKEPLIRWEKTWVFYVRAPIKNAAKKGIGE